MSSSLLLITRKAYFFVFHTSLEIEQDLQQMREYVGKLLLIFNQICINTKTSFPGGNAIHIISRIFRTEQKLTINFV